MADIDIQYTHIRGTNNTVADILSIWQGTPSQVKYLHSHVKHPIWLQVSRLGRLGDPGVSPPPRQWGFVIC